MGCTCAGAVQTPAHAHTHKCTHTCTHAYMHTYPHTCTHTTVYTHMCTYTAGESDIGSRLARNVIELKMVMLKMRKVI